MKTSLILTIIIYILIVTTGFRHVDRNITSTYHPSKIATADNTSQKNNQTLTGNSDPGSDISPETLNRCLYGWFSQPNKSINTFSDCFAKTFKLILTTFLNKPSKPDP